MLLSETPICVIDTETTGLEAGKDRLVEIGAKLLYPNGSVALFQTLVNPGFSIPVQSMAVHHITDADVQGAPLVDDALAMIDRFIPKNALVAAHNAEFDNGFLPSLGDRPWLCTSRLAQHIWPEAPAFKNQVLRYWLGLNVDLAGMVPHRALADVLVTTEILKREIEEYSPLYGEDVDGIVTFAESPFLVKKWAFGKYKDQQLCAADTGYLRWMLSPDAAAKCKPSRDLIYSVELELQRRRQEAA